MKSNSDDIGNLYRKNQKSIESYLFKYYIVHQGYVNADDVKDNVQDLFKKVLLKRETFNKGNNTGLLLYLGRNFAVDTLRKKNGRHFNRNYVIFDERNENFGFSSNEGENNVYSEEKKNLLLKEVRNLETKNALPISLKFYDNMTQKDIGKLLNVSASAVSNKINYGINQLKSNLTKKHPEHFN